MEDVEIVRDGSSKPPSGSCLDLAKPLNAISPAPDGDRIVAAGRDGALIANSSSNLFLARDCDSVHRSCSLLPSFPFISLYSCSPQDLRCATARHEPGVHRGGEPAPHREEVKSQLQRRGRAVAPNGECVSPSPAHKHFTFALPFDHTGHEHAVTHPCCCVAHERRRQ